MFAGLFQWLVFPNFLRVVWKDDRAFDDGPTAFLVVHVAIVVPALLLGLGLIALGVTAWRRAPSARS
ncbi:MAG: putative integral rane protein match [Frankiales bacterium]|nr:putative integral rane protein match [Frankiales bacterium]